MRVFLKILLFPVVLVLTVLVAFCRFVCLFSGMIFGIGCVCPTDKQGYCGKACPSPFGSAPQPYCRFDSGPLKRKIFRIGREAFGA